LYAALFFVLAYFSSEPGMTKKEIVKTISEEIKQTQQETKKIVQKTLDAIIEALLVEGRVELRRFGVFEVKKRGARNARNPRTNQKVAVPAKYVVSFKPGKEMESRLKELESQDAERFRTIFAFDGEGDSEGSRADPDKGQG
jgi:nucleoid DNA-binding protein